MRIVGLALISSLFLALGGGTAVAQDPSVRGYDESLGVIGEIQSEEPTPTPTQEVTPTPPQQQQQPESDLPFTGLDLGIVALLGGILLATGLVLRRTTRRAPTA
ncbi:MAG TPA: hypothetical protein VF587_00830 [Solirubrobacteraceae bacterium]|jgi:hypothetical protein